MNIKCQTFLLAGSLGLAAMAPARAATNGWSFDISLYGLAAGMSGDVTVKGVKSDLNVGFDDIWNNIQAGAMGTVRIGYDRWSLNTDVIYMALAGSKGRVDAEFDQLMVNPTLNYRVCRYFEPYAGARYNYLHADISGTGPLGNPRDVSGTQDWWDPVIGVNVMLPICRSLSFKVHGDIGGFGLGSDFTWQAYPYFDWRFCRWGSLQAGYRFMLIDYDTGSGRNHFVYDVLTQGPQLGITFSF